MQWTEVHPVTRLYVRPSSEITVANQIEGSDGAVERCCEQHIPLFGELACSHCGHVFGESDDTESGIDIPDLHLAIIGTCYNHVAIWGVSNGVDNVRVSLLLQNIGLGLPLPPVYKL